MEVSAESAIIDVCSQGLETVTTNVLVAVTVVNKDKAPIRFMLCVPT